MVSHRACFFFSKPRRGSLEHVGALNWRGVRLTTPSMPGRGPVEHPARNPHEDAGALAVEHAPEPSRDTPQETPLEEPTTGS